MNFELSVEKIKFEEKYKNKVAAFSQKGKLNFGNIMEATKKEGKIQRT